MGARRSESVDAGGTSWLAPQPLVALLVATAGGILVDRYAQWPLFLWLSAAPLGLLAWYAAWCAARDRLAAALLLLAAVATGGGGHLVYWHLFFADDLGRAADDSSRPVCLEAIALDSPRLIPAPPPDAFQPIPRSERTTLTLRVTRVRDGRCWRPASGRTTLQVDGRLDGVAAGDRLRVFGLPRRPPVPRNPGELDRARFRRSQRELCELRSRFPESVQRLEQGPTRSPRAVLYRIRQACRGQLDAHLARRQAELAAAVLLGARDELAAERVDEFFLTGTIHLLAISGLHVGILAAGLWWVLRLLALHRRWSILAAAAFVVLYAVLVEARPPVVRAAVLIVAFCAARLSGRRGSSYNTLAAAALLLLAANPTLLFQIGPQLSFLAVATMAAFGPRWIGPGREDPLDRLLARASPWPVRIARRLLRSLGALALVTALIWLVALPLVISRFQLVSPIALLLNPLLWAPMAVALFAGFAVLVFGWILPPIATACGWVCNASLALLETAVHWASGLPGGHFWMPAPAGWWVLGFYMLLASFLWLPRDQLPRRWRAALLAAWLAAGCWWAGPRQSSPQALVCTFVSLGHGACTIIELPDGRTLLCDAGGMSNPEFVARAISACLWSRGITHLDAVILSHADADHYNALPELLQRFSAGAVYVSPLMFRQASEPLRALRAAILQAVPEIRLLQAGDRLAADPQIQIEVLHPPAGGVIGSDNANSLVLSIEHRGGGILLPADLESPGLEDVMAEEPRRWDVVAAPHHGSGTQQQAAFSRWARPRWVVISGSDPARTAAVEADYRARGVHVLHTTREGAIRAIITADDVTVYRWQGAWRDAVASRREANAGLGESGLRVETGRRARNNPRYSSDSSGMVSRRCSSRPARARCSRLRTVPTEISRICAISS